MTKLKLTDREWGEFKVKDIFQIFTGALVDKAILTEGKIPRVTASDVNNGIAVFTKTAPDKHFREFNNFISISFLGSVFYHHGTVSLDMKIHGVKPKGHQLNACTAKFLIPIIKKFAFKYRYGYQLSQSILKAQKMMLPINSLCEPDWQFMEDFIRHKEERQINKLKEYYSNKALSLMMSLGQIKDREWKEFFIGGENGVFDIRATQSGIDKNKLNAVVGDTPYVTRSDLDNGINLLVSDEQDIKYSKDKGNAITIGLDTQTVFYQKNSFWTGQNIQVLRNEHLNYWVAMFVIPLLKIQMKKFSWGSTGATLGRLNRTKIMLPVNASDCPDWQFMEDFMKKIEQDKTSIVLNYYNSQKHNENLSGGGVNDCLTNCSWLTFVLEDVCDIQSGVRLTKQDMHQGNKPFIGASDANNGITAFVSNQNASLDKNVLGVNYNGSVVENFYHPYEALFSDDVKRLKIKHFAAGKYAYLFLKTLILKQKSKYQYGYKFNAARMAKQKILLPVNARNQPDWVLIERYMQRQELSRVIEYLSYLRNSIKSMRP